MSHREMKPRSVPAVTHEVADVIPEAPDDGMAKLLTQPNFGLFAKNGKFSN